MKDSLTQCPHPLVCVLIAHTRPLPAVYGYAHLLMPAHFCYDSPLPCALRPLFVNILRDK
jgi:hypothetical protein